MGHHYEQDGTLIPNTDMPNPYRELPHLKVHETEYLLLHLVAHQENLTLQVWMNQVLRIAAGLKTESDGSDDHTRLRHVLDNAPKVKRLIPSPLRSETVPGMVELSYKDRSDHTSDEYDLVSNGFA